MFCGNIRFWFGRMSHLMEPNDPSFFFLLFQIYARAYAHMPIPKCEAETVTKGEKKNKKEADETSGSVTEFK